MFMQRHAVRFNNEEVIYQHKITDENFYLKAHSHNDYELIFFCEGDVSYTIENKKFQLNKFDLVITRPTAHHNLIINKVRCDMVRKGDMLTVNDIVDILSEDLIGVIPDDETVIVTTNRGEPAVLSAHRSLAGNAYRNIAKRICGETVPICLRIDGKRKKPSLLKRIFKSGFSYEEEEEYCL